MRFFEVAAKPLRIVATKRFLKDTPHFLRGYPGLNKTLKDFLDFKSNNPKADFGRKDAVFTGGQQVGNLRHVHLVHGKAILLYEIIDGQLRLYDMVEHNGVERKEFERVTNYITHLGANDFSPYEAPGSRPPENDVRAQLPPAHMQELEALFYEMAAQDRDIIEAALHGNFADIMEFMTLAVPEDSGTLMRVYGGPEGLQKHLRGILKQVAHR